MPFSVFVCYLPFDKVSRPLKSTKFFLHFLKPIQEEEIQDVFFEITKSIASEELRTFGIHLGCQDHKINFLIENNKYVQDAAYKLLLYAKEKYADDAKMWKKIIEALEILEKNRTIKKLRLKEILTAAQEKHPVIITVRKRSCGKVMFSQACVKNSVHGRGRCAPLWADTLLDRHPPGQTPPRPDTTRPDTPWADPLPIRRSLQGIVRTLTECILVYNTFVKYFLFKWKLD